MDTIGISRTLKLSKLTCALCEARIRDRLVIINGIIDVDVSYKKQELTVIYKEEQVTIETIINTIKELDYEVVEELENTKGKKTSYLKFIIVVVLLWGGYLFAENTVGFQFFPEIDSNMSLGFLFVIGLFTSIHCVAMCGGIHLSTCISYSGKMNQKYNNHLAKVMPSVMYNIGRVLSYTVIGGIVGGLGSVIKISNTGSAFISILAGVFMIIMGLNLLNISPKLRKLIPQMPIVLTKKINKEKQSKGPFVIGLLNGLMPCGPLQAMQVYALGTGSILGGAAAMFMFSLGTVPLLLGFGVLGTVLTSKHTKGMMKVSAVLVMVLGLIMLNRGFAITGIKINPFMIVNQSDENAQINTQENEQTLDLDVQKVSTILESRRYEPITIQKGIPVEWTIVANESNLNGCNNVIIIPEYNIQKELVVGNNIIEFTPTESGEFGYSCWMGMIRSSITVVSDK